MSVCQLTDFQLDQLRYDLFYSGGEAQEIADFFGDPLLIPDSVILEFYAGVVFVPEDFELLAEVYG